MSSAGRGANKVIVKVFLLALIFILGGYYFRDTLFPDPQIDPDAHFKGCKLIAENCVDVTTCVMNPYCAGGAITDCRIYDCANKYGVATRDAAGKISFREEAKPDEGATDATRAACKGAMEVTDRKCVDGKTKIDLKLDTQGECPIESFAVIFKEAGVVNSEFISKGDGTYSITADTCGTIDQIIPAATGGIGLEYGQSSI